MKITAISVSDRKGIRKKNVDSATLVENFGVKGDAHGGKWHRQLSFLAQESIDTMREKGERGAHALLRPANSHLTG